MLTGAAGRCHSVQVWLETEGERVVARKICSVACTALDMYEGEVVRRSMEGEGHGGVFVGA